MRTARQISKTCATLCHGGTPDASQDSYQYGLITNPEFKIPQLAPDGNYCPNQVISGDVNEDSIVNILDVILTINIILGIDNFNSMADINDDDVVDVLDIVQIVNIILE